MCEPHCSESIEAGLRYKDGYDFVAPESAGDGPLRSLPAKSEFCMGLN